MNIEELFRTVECQQVKPFDIRRERREFRKYCKQYGCSKAKLDLRYFRTARKFFKYMTEGCDERYEE